MAITGLVICASNPPHMVSGLTTVEEHGHTESNPRCQARIHLLNTSRNLGLHFGQTERLATVAWAGAVTVLTVLTLESSLAMAWGDAPVGDREGKSPFHVSCAISYGNSSDLPVCRIGMPHQLNLALPKPRLHCHLPRPEDCPAPDRRSNGQ
jgi:hypothetical protein